MPERTQKWGRYHVGNGQQLDCTGGKSTMNNLSDTTKVKYIKLHLKPVISDENLFMLFDDHFYDDWSLLCSLSVR
jgi:hypothetical protein